MPTPDPGAYHERVARCFLLPYAPDGQRLVVWPKGLRKLDPTRIGLACTTDAGGYAATLTIPLDLLELPGRVLGLDLVVDDAVGEAKDASALGWCSPGRAHLDRTGFGLVVLP